MAAGQLSYNSWKEVTEYYPEGDVIDAILGICKFGARIGYQERRILVTIHPNLAISEEDKYLVRADIQSVLEMGRLKQYTTPDTLPNNYTASPLRLVDKADGSKRRIHHLSYPPDNIPSINSGIPEEYGSLTYSKIDQAIEAIQTYGRNCQLTKKDFESAFSVRYGASEAP